MTIKALYSFIAILFLIICSVISPAFSNPQQKKEVKKKHVDTVTVSKKEYDKMLQDMRSMQNQINSLKREFEGLRKEKAAETAASQPEVAAPPQSDPQSSGAQATESPSKEKTAVTGETTLEKLQSEMQSSASVPAAPQPPQGSVDSNPKISLIGDFVWNINHNKKLDGGDPFNIRELELGFQDNIDPWSKADVYLALEKEEDGKYSIDPEEAYVTLSKMPFRTQMRIGRWLLPFGKDNPTHTHAKPYVDQPDVITNFMGPDGMKGTGMEVSAVLPTGKLYTELTGNVINDESDISFSNGSSGKPLYLGHLRTYMDLTESSNLELGYSYLTGYNNALTSKLTTIQGADLTYRWKPLQSGNYNSFLLRGEYLWSSRNNSNSNVNSSGYYGFAQYQLNRNWYIGTRYDNTGYPELVNSREQSYSGILTYYPTEFSFYRLQWKKTDPSFAPGFNQWLFQMNFSIGPHGTHKF